MPGRLGGLGGRAPGPDRLADEPGAVRAAAVGEPADGRDDPGRIAAEHGHVGERYRLACLAQGAADQVQPSAGNRDEHGFPGAHPLAHERAHFPGVLVAALVEQRVMSKSPGLQEALCRRHRIITSSYPPLPRPP